IRRSVSCPRSISVMTTHPQGTEHRPFSAKPATQIPRPSSLNRSHSLNRSSSAVRMAQTTSLGTIHSSVRTKEQEATLTKETLFIFNDMRIRFPGKTDEKAELILEDVSISEEEFSFWFVLKHLEMLESTEYVLDIVKTSVRSVLQRIWRVSDVECLHLYRLFNRVFNRLLWSHGQGLWNCFCNSGSSWETIFSKSTEVVTSEQLQCCQRIVQLCKQCLLVVYKYSTDSRGSLTGINPDWDDTRYLLPGPSQFIMRPTSSSFSCSSSGMPRSNILFTPRYGYL
uniref:Uncharacterized protein n=1 Tax=Sphenodon punctatus TaxID=8508 RepID=A0A8D0HHM0_SPHPU